MSGLESDLVRPKAMTVEVGFVKKFVTHFMQLNNLVAEILVSFRMWDAVQVTGR